MATVFISHTADTKRWAETLFHTLQTAGLSPWLSEASIQGSEPPVQQVERALSDAMVYVFLVGPQRRDSRWFEFESERALKKTWTDSGKRMLPVLMGGVEAPPFLRAWSALKFDKTVTKDDFARKTLAAVERAPVQSGAPSTSFRPGKEWRRRMREIESAARRLKSSQSS